MSISEISLIFTILGVILTIGTIVVSYWKKKYQISHYQINSYEIGNGLSNIFPDFQLHYKNDVLSNNVNVLQGGFINTGRNDIGNANEEIFIKLFLPEDCIVKAVKVSPLVRGLSVEPVETDENKNAIMKNEISFKIIGLFKSNECFDYSAIIESAKTISFFDDDLQFEHRIKDVNEGIQSTYIGQYYNLNTLSNNYLYIFLLFFVVLFLCVCIISFDRNSISTISSRPSVLIPITASILGSLFMLIHAARGLLGRSNRIVHVLNKNKKKKIKKRK